MEKEQKKLLLVAVSVGVFLLVTITVAIIMLTPKVNNEQAAFSSPYPISSGRIQPADSINTPAQPVITNSQETNINVNRENSTSAATVAAGRNNGEHLTIQIPRPTTAAVPDNPDITPSSAPRPVAAAVPAKPAAKPAPATQSAASPRAPAARQTTPARSTNDYWIQTGAYSAIVRAEDMKELLASKGLTSIIETRVVEGRNLYRVRLGPYTSEREANYWLALVKSIDGFSESQVRQTVRQQ
jgi:DedD protein